MRSSLRARIFLTVTLTVMIGVALVYFMTSRIQTSMMLEERLLQEAHLATTLARMLSDQPLSKEEDRMKALHGVADGEYVRGVFLLSRWGEPLSTRESEELYELVNPTSVQDLFTSGLSARYVRGSDGREYMVAFSSISLESGEDEYRLLVISSPEQLDKRLSVADELVWLFAFLVFILVLSIGYFLLSRIVVQPVRDLVRTTQKVHDDVEAAGISMPAVEAGDDLVRLQQMLVILRSRMQEVGARVSASAREERVVQRKLRSAEKSLVRTEKLASVGVLTAGIAHEIGNPMGVILSGLDLLKDGDFTGEELERYLSQMEKATERMDQMIRDLLRFSRSNRPPSGGIHGAVLQDVVERSVQLVQPQTRLKQVELHIDLPTEPVHVEVDGTQLEQILVNLLLNAGDAMGNRGEVHVRGWVEDPHVLISVRDEGVGVKEEDLEHIFDPFFTTKDEKEGTGLGLAICRHIAREFGGEIFVESTDEAGTTFTVQLWMVGWNREFAEKTEAIPDSSDQTP